MPDSTDETILITDHPLSGWSVIITQNPILMERHFFEFSHDDHPLPLPLFYSRNTPCGWIDYIFSYMLGDICGQFINPLMGLLLQAFLKTQPR